MKWRMVALSKCIWFVTLDLFLISWTDISANIADWAAGLTYTLTLFKWDMTEMSAHSILSVGANHKSIFLSKMCLLIEQLPQTTLSWVGICCVLVGVERRNQGRKEGISDGQKERLSNRRKTGIDYGRKEGSQWWKEGTNDERKESVKNVKD